MTSTPTALTKLQDISAAFYAGKIDRDEARSRVIDVVFTRLGSSRVSLWRFDGEGDELNLLCFAAKTAGGRLNARPSLLRGSEYREYFGGLVKNGMYVAGGLPSNAEQRRLQPCVAAGL